MVISGIPLIPLAEEIWAADPSFISPFYAEDVAFNGSAQRSAKLLMLLMDGGSYLGYFPDSSRSLFTMDIPRQEEAYKREFASEGLDLYFVGGSWYLGAYLGLRKELDGWPHGVTFLGKIS